MALPTDIVHHDARDSVDLFNQTNAFANGLDTRVLVLEAAPSGGGGTGINLDGIFVASSDSPQSVKDVADYVCTGTNDQTFINQAIDKAYSSRGLNPPGSAQNRGAVILSGGRFNIGNPGILMKTGVWVRGAGYLTEVRAVSCTATGVFRLAPTYQPTNDGSNHHLCKVSDLWINGNSSSGGTCNALDFDMTGSATSSDPNGTGGYPGVNADSYHLVYNLLVTSFSNGTRHGIYMHSTGTANNRGNVVHDIQMRDCSGNGIWFSAASDSFVYACHVGGSGDTAYRIATGNTKVYGCKSFYSNVTGFYFSSGRGLVTACESQDDVTGFYFDAAPYNATGIVADTARLAGIRVSTSGLVLNGASIFWRSGGRGSWPSGASTVMDKGLHFDGTYTDLNITATITPAGGITIPYDGVTFSPGARSFVRVSDGTTLNSVG